MLRREFTKAVCAAVALQSLSCQANGRESVQDQDDDVFDGTGIVPLPPRPKRIEVEKPVSHPLWLRRDKEVFRMDVATPEGYKVAQWVLRDVQAGRMGLPDMKLLEHISLAQVALARLSLLSRFDILSGMRTHATNNKTEGAAKSSLHLPDANGRFKALDFRARGFDAPFTAKLMGMVGMTGIGLYWDSNFVHADTGRKVKWAKAKP